MGIRGIVGKRALIFFEGDTENNFHRKRLFQEVIDRRVKRQYRTLNSISNVNNNVADEIDYYLRDRANHTDDLYAYVFADREGLATQPPRFMANEVWKSLKKQGSKDSRIDLLKAIECVEAIPMIEGWFFHDFEGICRYLNLPVTASRKRTYCKIGISGKRELRTLFRLAGRYYRETDQSFIDALDIRRIFESSEALQEGVRKIHEHFGI